LRIEISILRSMPYLPLVSQEVPESHAPRRFIQRALQHHQVLRKQTDGHTGVAGLSHVHRAWTYWADLLQEGAVPWIHGWRFWGPRPIDMFMTYRQTKIAFFGGIFHFVQIHLTLEEQCFVRETLWIICGKMCVCVYCSIVFLVRWRFLIGILCC